MPSKTSSMKKSSRGAAPADKSAGVAAEHLPQKPGGKNPPRNPPSRKKTAQRPRSPQQRLKVPEAMRLHGMDEEKFAKKMRGLIAKLSRPKSSPKLLLDGIKEWGRHLAPDRTTDRGASETPVTVHLVHNVARPERVTPGQDSPEETREEVHEEVGA